MNKRIVDPRLHFRSCIEAREKERDSLYLRWLHRGRVSCMDEGPRLRLYCLQTAINFGYELIDRSGTAIAGWRSDYYLPSSDIIQEV